MELGNDEVGRCIAIIYTCSRFCIGVSAYEFICLLNVTSSVLRYMYINFVFINPRYCATFFFDTLFEGKG